MRITERRLRQIIRNVIRESVTLEEDLDVDPKLVGFFQKQISESSYNLTEGESPKQIAIALALFFTVLAGGLKGLTMLDQAEQANLMKKMHTIQVAAKDGKCNLPGDSELPDGQTIYDVLNKIESQYTGLTGRPHHRIKTKGPVAKEAQKTSKILKRNCD